jgi:hypothetical protein
MSLAQNGTRTSGVRLERGSFILLGACAVSAVAAFAAADHRQAMWLLWTMPFVVAVWIGFVLRPASTALIVGIAYGLALLPAVGLAVHRGSTSDRLMESLTSGRAALFGVPLALILGVVAFAISNSLSKTAAGHSPQPTD